MSTANHVERRQSSATVRLTQRGATLWAVASVAAFFGFAYVFGLAIAAIRGESFDPIVVSAIAAIDPPAVAIAAVVLVGCVVVPHELVHGLVLSRYGTRPAYGAGVSSLALPFAYVRHHDAAVDRNQLVVASLAPFVGLTAFGLLVAFVYPSPWLLLALAANAAGSIGDLWMATTLLGYPAESRVAGLPDGETGFELYAPEGFDGDLGHSQALSAFVVGTVATFASLSFALVGLVLASVAAKSGPVVVGGRGDWFLFSHWYDPATGTAVVSVGERAVAAIATGGGLAWTLIDGLRRRFVDAD